MDGFTSIPIQSAGTQAQKENPPVFSSAPYKDNAVTEKDGIQIAEDTGNKKEKSSHSMLLSLSIISLLCVLGYFGYLVFLRIFTIEKISVLTDQFQVLSKNINKNDLDNFLAMDSSLKAINQKLQQHTQVGPVLAFVNRNIRSNVLVTDYAVDSQETLVVVTLASVAPTFKELAEQTEKMGELKITGAIKDFQISQMSLESDGRRVRFRLSVTFDKSKISVAALSAQATTPN